MRWIYGTLCVVALLAAANLTSAADAVHWTGDFRQACDTAAQQKRLVLLHFYSDNCAPCVRVDKEVFSQPQVAEAVERYCVPMKVHVEHTPELARKYNIQRWPTDVLVTPAGLEVYRTVSPRSAAEYMTMVEQVALHAGARPAAGGQVALGAAAPTQSTEYPGPYQGGPVAGNFQSQLPPSNRNTYQSGISQSTHQNIDTQRSPLVAAPGPGTSGEAPNVAPVGNPMGPMNPAPQPPAYAAAPQGGSRYFQSQPPAAENAPASGSVYQPAPPQQVAQQSAAPGGYGPPAGSPYTSNAAAPHSADPQGAQAAPQQPIINRYTQQQPAPYAAQSPPIQAGVQARPTNVAAAPAPSAAPYSLQPPFSPTISATASAPVAVQPPVPPPATMVPSSSAPAIVLDGCCAVSMVDTRRMKKADPQFGAVHRGRTYLFASAEEQKKFLADPDRYAVILSGFDAVRFSKTGELVEGKRQFGMMYQQKIYLFADEESLNQFAASPQFFSTSAHQAMLRTEAGSTQLR
jgi:YHS domain-containing protein/thiol-disulfide isomerase/thioredoxin